MALGRMFGKSSRATALGICLAAAFAGMPVLAGEETDAAGAAPAASASDVGKLLEEGLTLFRQDNIPGAISAFEKAFALDPAQDQVAEFMDSSQIIHVMRMLRNDDPKISGIAKAILDLRHKKVRTRIADQEQIKALIDKVFASKDEQEKMLDMLQGANLYGRNLVPLLLPKLGDAEPAVRSIAILWIPKIDIEAVPPLVAAARHPEAVVRQNIARLLGAKPLRHAYSLGALAAMIETDADPVVKSAARDSLEAILLDIDKKNVQPAKSYFLQIARMLYLYPHRNEFAGPQYAPTVYALKDSELVGEKVAPFQLSTRMAEAQLLEALRLDPAFTAAKITFLQNEARQVVEYDAALGFYKDAAEGDGAEVKATLDAQKDTFDWIRRNRVRAQPTEILFAALSGAVKDKQSDVAEKLIEVIQENGIRGAVPKALISALNDSTSKLVRTSAAISLAYWNPEDAAEIGDAVVGILSEAAVASGIRTIHKVMGNSFNANRFDSVFRELNIESGMNLSSISMALDRASKLPPDLILIDEDVPPVAGVSEKYPVNVFVNELRKGYRTQATPVVVAVESSRIEEAKKIYESAERKVTVIPADADRTAFKNQVYDKLFAETDDAKARATRQAKRAAEALAFLAANSRSFPVAGAAKDLQKVLQNRPDEVRIPAIVALGNLREAAAGTLLSLAQVFGNAENDGKVREAAMTSIGRILGGSASPASADVIKAIALGMADANLQLRAASYIAFASARASDAEQLRLLVEEAKAPAAGAPAGEKAGEEKAVEGEKKAEGEVEEKPAEEEKAEEKPAEEEKAEEEKATGE